MPELRALYRQELQSRDFVQDAAQERAVDALAAVQQALLEAPAPGLFARWFGRRPDTVRGLYMWGGVGRGKTWLMDIFFASLPITAKRRWHFHRFMAEVHEELKGLRELEDPLRILARRLARRARVICFDEFFVSDIADAMILGTLFQHLFEHGVTLVATSNLPPADLYKDGLQRARFLPAIEAIQRHTAVLNVDSGIDYRLRELEREPLFYTPDDAKARSQLGGRFALISRDSAETAAPLLIRKRRIPVERAADGVAWFDFAALCEGARGTDDYIEIARLFHTVLISGMPRLDWQREDAARRFIALVDEFYERRVKLLIAAAVPMTKLYAGERLDFEFARTLSRLQEMQSHDYLAEAHRP